VNPPKVLLTYILANISKDIVKGIFNVNFRMELEIIKTLRPLNDGIYQSAENKLLKRRLPFESKSI